MTYPPRAKTPLRGVDPLIAEMAFLLGPYSLKEVSEKSGLPYWTIVSWYRGRSVPTLSNFRAVLNALGFDLSIVPILPQDTSPSSLEQSAALSAGRQSPLPEASVLSPAPEGSHEE